MVRPELQKKIDFAIMLIQQAEHTAIHNKQNEILRDKTNGRIIGIIKRQVI